MTANYQEAATAALATIVRLNVEQSAEEAQSASSTVERILAVGEAVQTICPVDDQGKRSDKSAWTLDQLEASVVKPSQGHKVGEIRSWPWRSRSSFSKCRAVFRHFRSADHALNTLAKHESKKGRPEQASILDRLYAVNATPRRKPAKVTTSQTPEQAPADGGESSTPEQAGPSTVVEPDGRIVQVRAAVATILDGSNLAILSDDELKSLMVACAREAEERQASQMTPNVERTRKAA